MALSWAQHPFRWEDDVLPTCSDVRSGQRRAIVELDPLADLERVGLAVVARFRDFGAQIADKIGRRAGILRIDPYQHAVKGRSRMNGGVSCLAMRVEARWRVRRN